MYAMNELDDNVALNAVSLSKYRLAATIIPATNSPQSEYLKSAYPRIIANGLSFPISEVTRR